jgi:membrane protease YdiL (CAAX protease family)
MTIEKIQPTSSRPTSMAAFLIGAYALTWVLLGPWFYVFNVKYGGELQPWMWAWVPFAFFGGWGPTLAAIIVTALGQGRPGVRQLIRSVTVWRVPLRWYLLVAVFPPAVTALSVLVVDQSFGTLRNFDAGAALAALPAVYLLALPFGPLGEELGWRGFALPKLLPRHGPMVASLVLGVIWTFWHAPMMLWSPGASIPSFMGLSAFAVAVYLVQVTSITVLMTWLFLRTQGSVLLAVLAHLTFNTAEAVLYGGLPKLAVAKERAVYLVNVTLLTAIAAAALWHLSIARRDHR